MHYLTHTPAAPLNEFVDYLWLVTNGRSDRMERILPSATIELVVNLHKNQIRIYDPLTLEARARFSGAVMSGTYTAPFACNGEEHTAMFGVHFKPGGALPFLTVPASELADSHVDLRDLSGLTAQADISWKDLAQKCGYFDQAHLVRDFREFAYACPSELGDEPDTLRNHFALTG